MKIVASSGRYLFAKLEQAQEVDFFEIPCAFGENEDGFEFFRGMGIIDYKKSFKVWLRKFPRPVLIAAVEDRYIVSWIFIEEWPENAKDGAPVYVLRAIETIKGLREKRIGFRLLLLGALQVPGYLITKPLNKRAETFFKKSGFMEEDEFRRKPLDLTKNHGYLILPPFKKRLLLEGIERYFDDIEDGRK